MGSSSWATHCSSPWYRVWALARHSALWPTQFRMRGLHASKNAANACFCMHDSAKKQVKASCTVGVGGCRAPGIDSKSVLEQLCSKRQSSMTALVTTAPSVTRSDVLSFYPHLLKPTNKVSKYKALQETSSVRASSDFWRSGPFYLTWSCTNSRNQL